MKGTFRKQPHDVYIPADVETEQWLQGIKLNEIFRVEMSKPQNLKFHQKLICLFKVGYEVWEPSISVTPTKYGVPEKTFKQFRKDMTIMAGYYTQKVRLNGEIITEAKSISFRNMNAEDREILFNNVINALLKHVLKNYTKDDLENQVNTILGFT